MHIPPISSGGYSPNAAGAPIQAQAVQPLASNSSAQPSAPVESPSEAVQPATFPSVEHIKDAVGRLNKVVPSMSNDVRFLLDEETSIRVVKVVNTQTEEVIRQFPDEEIIELAKALDSLQGLLIHQTA